MGSALDVYVIIYPPALVTQKVARLWDATGGSRRGVSAAMPPDRMHLTVQPLGRYMQRVPVSLLQIMNRVAAMVYQPPFQTSFDLLQSRSPEGALGTVELAGRGHGVQPLLEFHRRLVEAMQQAGFPEGDIRKSFYPHLTVDYKHRSVPRRVVTPFAWLVTEFCLVVSHFGEGRHEILARWPLKDKQMPLFF